MVLRMLFSLAAFFALLKLILWPITQLLKDQPSAAAAGSEKRGQRLRATPLKKCSCCNLHLPENQGQLFGGNFFCDESCRRAYYS